MSTKQCFNPYLPSYEYVPDGEPHIFGDRIYVYGSHDLFDGNNFCLGDYICWSCPVDDVKEWRYEGVIWRKDQDPMNKSGKKPLYAPDVCQGADGKYYLYYFISYFGVIGVAKCDTPAGKYEFLGYVHYKDGTLLGKKKGDIFQFDPGVYTENGKTYLYSGFCPVHYPFFLTGGKPLSKHGPICAVLGEDMLTIEQEPKFIGVECKLSAKGTPYEGHEFFEASSMRKINDKYYFIYSSFLGHELCYAVSDKPNGTFTYGGVIVSIGDVGLRGIKGVKDSQNFCGNTHGSIVCDAQGQYYIFYHRQTNRHCFSRQACAEEITIEKDGSIRQVELTSCGLNKGALNGKGKYEARIASSLYSPKGGKFYSVFKCVGRPYFTQTGKDRENNPDQYIANMDNGSVAGFKYFDMKDEKSLTVTVKGSAKGKFVVTDGKNTLSQIEISPSKEYKEFSSNINIKDGVSPLFFRYEGTGKLDFMSFELK